MTSGFVILTGKFVKQIIELKFNQSKIEQLWKIKIYQTVLKILEY